MATITTRTAQLSDCEELARIHVQTWQCAYRGQMPDSVLDSLSVEKRKTRWQKILTKAEKGVSTLVAEIDGQLAGFSTVGYCRDEDMVYSTGELWSLYVDPAQMNKGVGAVLMSAAFAALKGLGYSSATLWVLISNKKTRRWYEKRGWVLEGDTKDDDKDGFTLREIRYTHALE